MSKNSSVSPSSVLVVCDFGHLFSYAAQVVFNAYAKENGIPLHFECTALKAGFHGKSPHRFVRGIVGAPFNEVPVAHVPVEQFDKHSIVVAVDLRTFFAASQLRQRGQFTAPLCAIGRGFQIPQCERPRHAYGVSTAAHVADFHKSVLSDVTEWVEMIHQCT